MILKLVIEHGKDATGIKKRIIWSNLTTNIKGMETIDSVSELNETCTLGKEITKMVEYIVNKSKKKLFKDYILKLQVSKIKTKSKDVERGMSTKLYLKNCIIEDLFELDKNSVIDKELVQMSTDLLAAKTADLKKERKAIIKEKKSFGKKK